MLGKNSRNYSGTGVCGERENLDTEYKWNLTWPFLSFFEVHCKEEPNRVYERKRDEEREREMEKREWIWSESTGSGTNIIGLKGKNNCKLSL